MKNGNLNEIFERLYIKHINKTSTGKIFSAKSKIIEEILEETGTRYSNGWYDDKVRNIDKDEMWRISRGNLPTREPIDYGIENENGLYYSNKYIEIDVHGKLEPSDVLLAHGFDPNLWEIVNAGSTGSKIGTSKNDEQYFINTYRRLTVRPKDILFNQEDFTDYLKDIKSYKAEMKYVEGVTKMMLITLFDQHFGINYCKDYESTQAKVIHRIETEHREDIFFAIGQDLLHNDNMRGTTSAGTPIEAVDMNVAIDEALRFYIPIIDKALENANNVHLIYSMGNHDEMASNMFVRVLAQRYPQCKLDISGEHPNISVVNQDKYGEYKLLTYHNNKIGLTHGTWVGRKKEKLHDNYMAFFPEQFTMLKQRTIITGHHHTDRLQDQNGTSVYSLSTRNKPDAWHVRNGFVGSKKRFKIFEFDENEMVGEFIV